MKNIFSVVSIKPWILLITFFSAFTALANEEGPGIIKGHVSTTDGKPAEMVTISIKGTTHSAITDDNGNFIIKNLKPGTYTIELSLVGHESVFQSVVVDGVHAAEVKLQINLAEKQLQEVIVVAGKTGYKVSSVSGSLRLNTSVNNLPQNIQVVSRQLMADQGTFDMLEGVSRNVSGVTKLEHWDMYVRLNMRGSRIAPFRNGMNVESTWGPLAEDISMVERVEFVKGPAGFMMANGEPSGFYNIVTKKPTGQTKGEANVTIGSYDTYRAAVDLDGKLSADGKLLYRLNVMGQLKGSHRPFEFSNRYSIAPVLKYQFNPKTSLTLEYTYQNMRSAPIGTAYVFAPDKYASAPRNTTIAEPGMERSVFRDHSSFLIFEQQFTPNWKFTAQLAYFNYDQVGTSMWADSVKANGDVYRNMGIWDAKNEGKYAQAFVNGKFNTGAVVHNILAGLDYGDKNYIADFSQSLPVNGKNIFNIYHPVHNMTPDEFPVFNRSIRLKDRPGASRLSQKVLGVYVQDELHFWNDRLRLTLAGRFTSSKDEEYGAGVSESQVTPRVGLSVSVDKNTSVYALYDQAFVPQTGKDKNDKKFNPVTGHNIEAGVKRDWFNGKWNSTVSVYQITKNNVLVTDPEDTRFSIQLGQTKTRGVEADVRGEVVKGLNLVLNYAFTESFISKDPDSKNAGNATPGTTKHINNGWLSYQLPGKLKGFAVASGYQWQMGRSSWFVFDGSEASLPSYFRLDGAISWHKGHYGINLNVNNLLDQYLYSGSPYGNYFYWQTEASRNFRLTLQYRW